MIAAGCTGGVGIIGIGTLWLLRRASLRILLQAASAIAILAVVAGTLGTAALASLLPNRVRADETAAALSPSPRPLTIPAAMASTFFAAPPISTPRTSVEW